MIVALPGLFSYLFFSDFRTFVRFVRVRTGRFSLPLGVWEGLRFVRLFGLCLFRFVGFLFLLGSGKGCGL